MNIDVSGPFYVRLAHGDVANTDEITSGIFVDYNAYGEVLGSSN